MNLNEAIEHLQDTLSDTNHNWSCEECKQEHEQLLVWLETLKAFESHIKLPPVDSTWIFSPRLPLPNRMVNVYTFNDLTYNDIKPKQGYLFLNNNGIPKMSILGNSLNAKDVVCWKYMESE